MNENQTNDDPAAIERDIRRTQEDMSRTVDRIGDQLTPKKIVNALLDKADESGVDTNYLIDGARRNPMALGLIAAGAIWLVSDKDSKFPSMPSRGKRPQAATRDEFDLSGSDVHHRDYVSHMSAFEMRENEEPQAYQRRRDLHRANFLMCEQRHDEDEHSFRQRLDDMTESFRNKRRAWSDSASQTGSDASRRARETAQQASDRAQDMFATNPLVTGILAAAVGAALGTTIPVSRTEQEKLGSLGGKARDMANEQKQSLTSKAMEKKDELLDKADQKLQQSSEGQPQGSQQPQRQPEPAFQTVGAEPRFGEETTTTSEGPFIIPDRTV
jgi:hypothetical protein